LALGIKELNLDPNQIIELSRESAESEITFLGFLVCENKMKAETPQVIKELNEAKINSLMVTGDNPLTAISVARDCNMIPEDSIVYLIEKETPKTKTFHIKLINPHKLEEESIQKGILENLDIFFKGIEEMLKEKNNCFALTGDSFEFLQGLLNKPECEKNIKSLFNRTIVFARMKPHNKSQLIVHLRSEKHFVLMTGG